MEVLHGAYDVLIEPSLPGVKYNVITNKADRTGALHLDHSLGLMALRATSPPLFLKAEYKGPICDVEPR
jgi:hypothetical protein